MNNLEEMIEQIPGWCPKAQGEFLKTESSRANSLGQTVIELGTFMGKSTAWIASGQNDPEGFYTIDLHDPNYATKKGIDPEETPEGYLAWLDMLDKVCFVKDDSAKWSGNYRTLDNRPVGMLYIDANHDYIAVKRDFDFWEPFLAEESLVVFDDYTIDHPGVRQFFDEIRYHAQVREHGMVGHAAWIRWTK